MKIANILIENFRQFQHKEIDFTDSLGVPRNLTVIAGPNTSGKTTLLDAIAIGPGLLTELPHSRPDFLLNSQTIRRGAFNTQITYCMNFSEEEIKTSQKILSAENPKTRIPLEQNVKVHWQYPDPQGKYPNGRVVCTPRDSWRLFKTRVTIARLLSRGMVDWTEFRNAGGVVTFDQQRTGIGKTIHRDVWSIVTGQQSDDDSKGIFTVEPDIILKSLALSSIAKSKPNSKTLDSFKLIQQEYNKICAPRYIEGIEANERGGFDIIFFDGTNRYTYEGLSSGEKMLLLFLIRMVSDNVHRSMVLVDEIELHQHPLWQRRLLYLLPQIGEDNQIITTTHSDYLRDVIPSESLIDLGDLIDEPNAEVA